MKKRIIVLLVLLTFICFVPNVLGYKVSKAIQVNLYQGRTPEFVWVYRSQDGTKPYLFCAKKGAKGPGECNGTSNYEFSTNEVEDGAIKAAIGAALDWHTTKAFECETGLCDKDGIKSNMYPRYLYTQLAIHMFLNEKIKDPSPNVNTNSNMCINKIGCNESKDPLLHVGELNNIISKMDTAYKEYKATLSLSSKTLTFKLQDDYYVSNEITVTHTNLASYNANLQINNKDANGRISIDGDKIKIRIPKDAPELNGATKMNVTLTVGASSKTFSIAKVRICNNGKAQPMVEEYPVSKTKDYDSVTASGELKLELDECESRLESIKDNKKERVELYEDLKSKGKDYKLLLNFDEKDADIICDSTKPVTCNYSNNSSCLSSSLGNTTFNENNISCYNNTISIDTQNYYCLTRFEFKNNMSEYKTDFVGPTGQAIKELSVNPIGSGNLITTCYNFNDSNNKVFIKYSDYIGDIKFNNESLVYNTNKANELVELKKNGNSYTSEISIDYSFKPIYVKNGTGEKVENNCSECKVLNNGFLTTFMYDIDKVVLPFSITFNNKAFSNIEVKEEKDGACTYTPEYELVKENELELEFREIKINSPFPGKEGDTRRVGSNWCERDASGKIISCSGSSDKNSLVNSMVERNDSYNKNGEEPKYKIVLTPDDIQAIKNYNLETQYDDYTLYCEGEGNECHSRFVDGLKTGTLEYYNTQTGKVENAFKIRNKLIVR